MPFPKQSMEDSQMRGFTSNSTAKFIHGQAASVVTCTGQTHSKLTAVARCQTY